MPLHCELLDQALRLAVEDETEAGSRRAASTAYYALFHLLVEAAARVVAPAEPIKLRLRVRRMFTHADIGKVCRQFSAGTMSVATRELMTGSVERDLVAVAEKFRQLQEARLLADYDLEFVVSQDWALEKVGLTETAFEQWDRVKATPNAAVFLTAFAFPKLCSGPT